MYRPILLGWIFAGLLTGSIVVGILAASGVLARAPTPPVAVQPGVATSKPPAAAPEVDPDPDLPPVKPAQPVMSDETGGARLLAEADRHIDPARVSSKGQEAYKRALRQLSAAYNEDLRTVIMQTLDMHDRLEKEHGIVLDCLDTMRTHGESPLEGDTYGQMLALQAALAVGMKSQPQPKEELSETAKSLLSKKSWTDEEMHLVELCGKGGQQEDSWYRLKRQAMGQPAFTFETPTTDSFAQSTEFWNWKDREAQSCLQAEAALLVYTWIDSKYHELETLVLNHPTGALYRVSASRDAAGMRCSIRFVGNLGWIANKDAKEPVRFREPGEKP
ncbi:MAG: hypothetical protein IMZ69_02620 [Spirochaetes bacterium]|nr:hypothetical protein [Spirochaetota bacterium]